MYVILDSKNISINVMYQEAKNVKLSRYKPGQALGVPGG
jgi:hypothetical protein